MNETTILEKQPLSNGPQETKKEGSAWKQVTLGGVSGILMGAGLLYAGQAAAQELGKEETLEEGKTEDVAAPEPGETSHTLENGLKVAAVNDDLSFGEAFAQARAEVGPGGVFHWHGGIYNTYSADEWNAMTIEQKHDFAQQVQPEIRPDELSTPTDVNTHVVVEHHVYHHEGQRLCDRRSGIRHLYRRGYAPADHRVPGVDPHSGQGACHRASILRQLPASRSTHVQMGMRPLSRPSEKRFPLRIHQTPDYPRRRQALR